MKQFIFIFSLFLLTTSGNAQMQYNWHFSLGSSVPTPTGGANLLDMEIGDSNHVYVTGWVCGDVDLDPGPGTQMVQTSGYTGYIAVYDDAGNYLRHWLAETTGQSEFRNICIAGNGDVIAVGSGYDTTDIDPGPGTQLIVGGCAFIARFTRYGQLLSVYEYPTIPGSADISFYGLDEHNGYICVGGSCNVYSGSYDIDPTSNTYLLYYTPLQYAYGIAMTLDPNGNLVNCVTCAGSYVYGVDLTPWMEIVATGGVYDTVDFNPGPLSYLYFPKCGPAPYGDFFVARYSSGGAYLWHYAAGNPALESAGYDVQVDAANNIYVAGGGNIDLNPGPLVQYTWNYGFVAKYLNSGQLGWFASGGAFDLDNGGFILNQDVNVGFDCFNSVGVSNWHMNYGFGAYILRYASNGNVYMAQSYAGGNDYDPGPGVIAEPTWPNDGVSFSLISLHHLYAGMDEANSSSALKAFPDPASEMITIRGYESNDGVYTITNSAGATVKSGPINTNETQLNVSDLPNGIYFFRDEGGSILRFVVNH